MIRIIIISLVLFFTVNAQTIWYVDRDATGSNTGRSWADAWNYLDSSAWVGTAGVNWNIIEAGDTIYVSGGTDSTLYISPSTSGYCVSPDVAYSFASGNPVVITKAWQENHNGDVYWGSRPTNNLKTFVMRRVSNVKLMNMTFLDSRTTPLAVSVIVTLGDGDGDNSDSLIYFENNHVIGTGNGNLISLNGYKITISNCIFEQLDNTNASEQDAMGINAGYGGHTINGNTFIMRNGFENFSMSGSGVTYGATTLTDTRLSLDVNSLRDAGIMATNGTDTSYLSVTSNTGTVVTGSAGWTGDGTPANGSSYTVTGDSHRDIMQWSNFGNSGVVPLVRNIISNNFLIDTKSDGTSWTGMIYSSNPTTNVDWYIYNNIFVSPKNHTSVGGIIINQPSASWVQSVYILNNTIIGNNGGSGASNPLTIANAYPTQSVDTIVIKNNIMLNDSVVTNQFLNLAIMYPAEAYFRDVDYNAYYEEGGAFEQFMSEGFGFITYAEWQADGWDTNSIDGNSTSVTFVDKGDTNIVSYYTETGRDLGVDLSATYPFLATDILGNPRTGTWDIGALEYQAPSGTTRKKSRVVIIQ